MEFVYIYQVECPQGPDLNPPALGLKFEQSSLEQSFPYKKSFPTKIRSSLTDLYLSTILLIHSIHFIFNMSNTGNVVGGHKANLNNPSAPVSLDL